jgi:hypothetical protein
LKRKSLFLILAVVPVAFMPLAATSQVIHGRGAAPAERAETTYKYEVFGGYGYTSLNQVNQSRYGLQGVDLSITRDWGRFFGLTADGASYSHPISSGNPCPTSAPCIPSVDAVLLGPVLHANLYGHLDGFFHVLLGGEHTGGESAYPKLSFAGGVGAGLEYKLNPHFALRASGDDIASSFIAPIYPVGSGDACTPISGCSPHMRRNSRAAFGVVYKF